MEQNQTIIVGVSGSSLSQEERKLFSKYQPGGYILFGRNIKAPLELRALIDELKSISRIPPIFTIDQEGGRVARLREIGNEPPSAKELAQKGDLSLIREHGRLTGKLLSLFGFNLNLCPVLDISFQDDLENSLKNRTWGTTPELVTERAQAFVDAMKAEGILSCGKHFPGYSRAQIDPHHELPTIERNRKELEEWEWKPFAALKNKMDSMMMGHAYYPQLDNSGLPSSLSKFFIQDVLRNEWNYQGMIMSDDLDMGAIVNQYSLGQAAAMSIESGSDLILLCHRVHLIEEAAQEIEKLSRDLLQDRIKRILFYKNKFRATPAFSLSAFQALNDEILELRTKVLGDREKAKQKTPENAKRSPVEDY